MIRPFNYPMFVTLLSCAGKKLSTDQLAHLMAACGGSKPIITVEGDGKVISVENDDIRCRCTQLLTDEEREAFVRAWHKERGHTETVNIEQGKEVVGQFAW